MTIEVRKVGENWWEIPRRGGMLVPGRILATAKQMGTLAADPVGMQMLLEWIHGLPPPAPQP